MPLRAASPAGELAGADGLRRWDHDLRLGRTRIEVPASPQHGSRSPKWGWLDAALPDAHAVAIVLHISYKRIR